jgi:hypothetical protein
MKSIIIAGASRCGKTTLTRKLQSGKGFTPIFTDLLVHSFRTHFPELGILHGGQHRKTTSSKFLPFLQSYMDGHAEWQGAPFVVDTTYLLPQQVIDHELHKKYTVLFVGSSNISPEEKLKNIRQNPNTPIEWTQKLDDNELLDVVLDVINFSKFLEQECNKLNLTFVDTSKNFQEVIDKKYNELVE